MCEFCTQHGEGKKWYLQMKNYADELIYQELSARQQELTGVATRTEWLARFFENDILPAMGLVPLPDAPAPPPDPHPSDEEILARRKVTHFGQVAPIEDVEQVLELADSITRLPCGCRLITTGKTNQRYCFGLGVDKWGILGKFPDAAASLEVLDKDEARRLFRAYDQEGLVHSLWADLTPYVAVICNCDHDCLPYRGYIEQGGSPRFFRAEYVCQVDWDVCTGCRSCMSQCQFGAQFYSSALARVYIDPARCFGCGVCRTACPSGAISLRPRHTVAEAANRWLR